MLVKLLRLCYYGNVPKLVDHHERRRELTDAVWRLVRREGVEAASVRNVAAEAGLSAGSLRHIVPSQADLLAAAMRAVVDRVEARVADLDGGTGPDAVYRRLRQLLPLDDERRVENEVWVAFASASLTRPSLRALSREVHAALRDGCTRAVRELGVTGRRVHVEAARLHALIDGLAVHAALHPDDSAPAALDAVLRRHVDGLSRHD